MRLRVDFLTEAEIQYLIDMPVESETGKKLAMDLNVLRAKKQHKWFVKKGRWAALRIYGERERIMEKDELLEALSRVSAEENEH